MENNTAYHIPVLFNECIEGLNIKPDGVYVDVTFGGGGHSRAIFEKDISYRNITKRRHFFNGPVNHFLKMVGRFKYQINISLVYMFYS